MRIGTWNLEGRWSAEHEQVLVDQACDHWLLTEVSTTTVVAGFDLHVTRASAIDGVRWAGLLTARQLTPLPDPDAASASARADGLLLCSTVLPWPLCGPDTHWPGDDHATRMAAALDHLRDGLDPTSLVWGGDWNQPLAGNLAGFTRRAQELVAAALDALGLQVPTTDLPARDSRQRSIDHIAVPGSWDVAAAERVSVPERLSDHDAYWIEAAPPDNVIRNGRPDDQHV